MILLLVCANLLCNNLSAAYTKLLLSLVTSSMPFVVKKFAAMCLEAGVIFNKNKSFVSLLLMYANDTLSFLSVDIHRSFSIVNVIQRPSNLKHEIL